MTSNPLKFNKLFFKDLWWLLKPYWTSQEKKSAFGLLALLILLIITGVYLSVALNAVTRDFYNGLQQFNKPAIIHALLRFGALIATSIFTYGYAFYVNGLLSIRWRRWLTKYFLDQWLKHRPHSQTQVHPIDNPDQRISEDLALFPEATLGIISMLLESCLTLVLFGQVLWHLSGNLSIPIGAFNVSIPGFLFFGALFYGILGIWITGKIGRKLATLDYQQQLFNADFRFSLVKLREFREEIALHRGESAENKMSDLLFHRIFHNFLTINTLKKHLAFFTNGYNTIAFLLGVFMAIPLYLQRKIQFGQLMQISGAFNSIMSGFSNLVRGFSVFAELRATVSRLAEFRRSIEQPTTIPSSLNIKEHEEETLIIEHLNLFLPSGAPLLKNINLIFYPKNTFLIQGPSGVGKSTLFKTIAQWWPHAAGEIKIPKNKNLFFLPQKPYLPLSTLKDILTYPDHSSVDPTILNHALECASLEKLKARLHETRDWSKEFSLGEQQCIGFVRLFLQQPDFIFLDESTSALDEKTEFFIYDHLRQQLPHATIVSISHRRSLEKFHEHLIVLDDLFSHSHTTIQSPDPHVAQ